MHNALAAYLCGVVCQASAAMPQQNEAFLANVRHLDERIEQQHQDIATTVRALCRNDGYGYCESSFGLAEMMLSDARKYLFKASIVRPSDTRMRVRLFLHAWFRIKAADQDFAETSYKFQFVAASAK